MLTLDFTQDQLVENSIIRINRTKSSVGCKGKYFKSLFICTTMGSSIKLDLEAFA
jgi:ribosomal protein L1